MGRDDMVATHQNGPIRYVLMVILFSWCFLVGVFSQVYCLLNIYSTSPNELGLLSGSFINTLLNVDYLVGQKGRTKDLY